MTSNNNKRKRAKLDPLDSDEEGVVGDLMGEMAAKVEPHRVKLVLRHMMKAQEMVERASAQRQKEKDARLDLIKTP